MPSDLPAFLRDWLAAAIEPSNEVIEFSLSASELGEIDAAAQRAGIDRETYCRRAAIEAALRDADDCPWVTPIAIEVASDLIPFVDGRPTGPSFCGRVVPALRDALFQELGVRFPGVRVRGNDDPSAMAPGAYVILVDEVPAAWGLLRASKALVAAPAEEVAALGIEAESAERRGAARFEAGQRASCWIALEHRAQAEAAGLSVWDPGGCLALHLEDVLRSRAPEFLGLQHVAIMLEKVEAAFPALVAEVVPKLLSLAQLTAVLRVLVDEGISIRDLLRILEALAEHGPTDDDPEVLAEAVRAALGRSIAFKYADGGQVIRAYLLAPELERELSGHEAELVAGLREHVEPSHAAVIVTEQHLRRRVRRLLAPEFPRVAVLARQELPRGVTVRSIAKLSAARPHRSRGD
jgi:type III secretion protein V